MQLFVELLLILFLLSSVSLVLWTLLRAVARVEIPKPEVDVGGLSWRMEHISIAHRQASKAVLAVTTAAMLALIPVAVDVAPARFAVWLVAIVLVGGLTLLNLWIRRLHTDIAADVYGITLTSWLRSPVRLAWPDVTSVLAESHGQAATDERLGIALRTKSGPLFLQGVGHDVEVANVVEWLENTRRNSGDVESAEIPAAPEELRRLMEAQTREGREHS